jgi:predicted DNA-binding transcriptional regulator YafY
MRSEERRANRTERLFALILLLQTRPNLTSRDLSEHFGVSRRTIFRDLRALSESGVPLTYGDRGGYEILEGYQLPPLMLSAREASTLLIGLEFMKLQSDASLGEDADHVGMKIHSVLPHEVRRYIDALRERTILDPYWLSAMRADETQEGHWFELSRAVADTKRVIMEYYVPARDDLTRRRVDPLGLVYYFDHWNLIAFDHLREDVRNFRLDRIRSMHVLTERFNVPHSFDLSDYLERGTTGSEDVPEVELWFSHDSFAAARRSLPARLLEEEETERGVRVLFRFDNLDYLSRWLVRFGDKVQIRRPTDLRSAVRAVAESIVAANS